MWNRMIVNEWYSAALVALAVSGATDWVRMLLVYSYVRFSLSKIMSCNGCVGLCFGCSSLMDTLLGR